MELASTFPFPYMPPGWTFAIAWMVIYLSLWAFLMFSWSKNGKGSKVIETISPLFWISCVLNILWIVSTALEMYVVSVALIVGLFIVLGTILNVINNHALTKRETWAVKIPFGLYYGWISLATCVIAVWQLVYQRNIELTMWQTWTIVVVWTWLLVAIYSRYKRRNRWQLAISLFAFAWIASALFL